MLALLLLAAPAHDLTAARDLSKVIITLKDQYVDPTQLLPREMLRGALTRLSTDFPAVKTDVKQAYEVRVSIAGASKTFSTAKLDTVWKLDFLLRDVVAFIAPYAPKLTGDSAELEHALVRGLLGAVDKRARFFDPREYKTAEPQPPGQCTFELPDGTALRIPCSMPR